MTNKIDSRINNLFFFYNFLHLILKLDNYKKLSITMFIIHI